MSLDVDRFYTAPFIFLHEANGRTKSHGQEGILVLEIAVLTEQCT